MSVEEWAKRHRSQGHQPYPSPTAENPERWLCDCPGIAGGAVWRIHTAEQIKQKFAHLGRAARLRDPQKRRVNRANTRTFDEMLDHIDGLLENWETGTDLPYGALPTVAQGFAEQLRGALHKSGARQ